MQWVKHKLGLVAKEDSQYYMVEVGAFACDDSKIYELRWNGHLIKLHPGSFEDCLEAAEKHRQKQLDNFHPDRL